MSALIFVSQIVSRWARVVLQFSNLNLHFLNISEILSEHDSSTFLNNIIIRQIIELSNFENYFVKIIINKRRWSKYINIIAFLSAIGFSSF